MSGDAGGDTADFVYPFQLGRLRQAAGPRVRGRLIRLGPALDRALASHAYPEPVAGLVGEAMVLAAALSCTLKFDGVFGLQVRGDGPVRLMVTDVTTAGHLRGYAQFDADRLAQAMATARPQAGSAVPENAVPRLLGSGVMAFTVDQGPQTERYQGVVALDGTTLAECAHHYFRQSEQLPTALKVAVGRDPAGHWHAAALMLQRVPRELTLDGYDTEDEAPGDDDLSPEEREQDDWLRAVMLLSTATDAELLDPALAAPVLLHRLFHEDGVRGFAPRPLRFGCRCSPARIAGVLRGIPREELPALKAEDGSVAVTCEFCGTVYRYDDAALALLLEDAPGSGGGDTP